MCSNRWPQRHSAVNTDKRHTDDKTEKKETGTKHKPGGGIERARRSWTEGPSSALPLSSQPSAHPILLPFGTPAWPGFHPASLSPALLTHCSSGRP